jgi:hypothetical protein
MIRLDLADPLVLGGYRNLFRTPKIPFALLPDALDPSEMAELRARVERLVEPFTLADRGHYHAGTAADELLCAELYVLAAAIVEAPLRAAGARWLRFAHGDYSLMRDDRERAPGRTLELTCDFSETSTGQGQIIYTDGRETLVVPQWPGSIALVEKSNTLYRYERYLTHTIGEQRIFRLRLQLHYVEDEHGRSDH